MKSRIFIGSSSEALSVCRAIQEELNHDFRVKVWDQDVFKLSFGPLDSLLEELDSSDAGIFILRPDDLLDSRGVTSDVARDNVLFELGMFMGRLGRTRTFMLQPESASTTMHLPSDIAGLTVARYDDTAFGQGDERAAVGSACNKIRRAVLGAASRPTVESAIQARLDQAMRSLSRDLQVLLSSPAETRGASDSGSHDELLSFTSGRVRVRVEVGRIEDYAQPIDERVVALPANEYFDDECISDHKSSLGAFVQHHFPGDVDELLADVRGCLRGAPSERVSRAEHRVEESYGIGHAICLNRRANGCRVVLVAATTERAGVGLRAEPHFLYAAIAGVVAITTERRLSNLVMPVFGSGHGGVPVPVALLFNLLAVRQVIQEDTGRMLREVTIVVFDGDASYVLGQPIEDIRAHLEVAAR